MDWDEVIKALTEALKAPETVDDVKAYINADTVSQTIIEDLSFKQTVLNILVAAKIVSEDDFNRSITHFKEIFTQQFAEEILRKIKILRGEVPEPQPAPEGIWVKIQDDAPEEPNLEDDDWPEGKMGKA